MKIHLIAFFTFFTLCQLLTAQLSFDGSPLTIDFTGFNGSGFAPNPEAGQLDSDHWAITGFSDGDLVFGGTMIADDYARGYSNTNGAGPSGGGVYSFLNNDALYVRLTAEDFTPGTITLRIQNNSPNTIDYFKIEYDILFRNSGDRSNSFDFEWFVNSMAETLEPAVAFLTPEAMDPGTPMVQYEPKSVVINAQISTGSTLHLRWKADDFSGSGGRDFLGIDNIMLTPIVADFDGTLYTNLQEALNAASTAGGGTVSLLLDHDASGLTIPAGVTLQIGDGLTYSNTTSVTNHGTVLLNGTGQFLNTTTGTYSGSGTYVGDFVNAGTVSP